MSALLDHNYTPLLDWYEVLKDIGPTSLEEKRTQSGTHQENHVCQGFSSNKIKVFHNLKLRSIGVLNVKMKSMFHIYMSPLADWYQEEKFIEPFWRRIDHKVVPIRNIKRKNHSISLP